jgi:hypothetical protein
MADLRLIEAGNAVAHRGDLEADAVIFAIGFLNRTDQEAHF